MDKLTPVKSPVVFLVMAFLSFQLSVILAEKFASHVMLLCPSGTFSSGPYQSYGILSELRAVALGLPLLIVIAHAVGRRLPTARSTIHLIDTTWNWKGWLVAGSLICLGTTTTWLLSGSQFCISQDAIFHRSLPWQTLRRYQWNDVVVVSAECSMQHGSPSPTYLMAMKDGLMLDVAYSDNFWEALPKIKSHLASGSFKFESGGVQSSCDPQHASLLRQKP